MRLDAIDWLQQRAASILGCFTTMPKCLVLLLCLQVVALLVFAAIMMTMVVSLAVHMMRKYVTGDGRGEYTKTATTQPRETIEDMLNASRALDDVEAAAGHPSREQQHHRHKEGHGNGAANGGGNGSVEERRGLMSGIVVQKGKGRGK